MRLADVDLTAIAGSIATAEAGQLRAAIGRTVPLADVLSALNELERTHQPKGKLLIAPAKGRA